MKDNNKDYKPVAPFHPERKMKDGKGWEKVLRTGLPTIDEARMQFANAALFPDPLGVRVVDNNNVVVFE